MRRNSKCISKRARVLLVDDHPLIRERLAEIINREADLTVCGEAEDRLSAVELALRASPDIAIVDITLKNSDGVELIKDLHDRLPSLRILVVSMHDESLYAERVIRSGAHGYITKQEATRNVLSAIRKVLNGGIYLNERVSARIIGRLATHGSTSLLPHEVLADRELQVFGMIGRGLSTREIADRLEISVKTVETYRVRIREKLQLQTASEMLQLAIAWTHKG